MTINFTASSAIIAFLAACLTMIVQAVTTAWIAVQARKLWMENRDRKAVEARALQLLDFLMKQKSPREATNDKGQIYRADIEERRFRLGVDRLLDRAVLLAVEWGAVTLRWDRGVYEVRLRTLSDPSTS